MVEYTDEPATGRLDGENFNTGFVGICDRPYPEMREAPRKIGKALLIAGYGRRWKMTIHCG